MTDGDPTQPERQSQDPMNNHSRSKSNSRPQIPALLIIIVALTGGCQPEAATAEDTPKAIFVIVDGIPADVIESVATPKLDAIAGDTGYTRSWVGGESGGTTESPTVSAVGYMSLITGTWSDKHNVYDNDVDDPNYEYWDIFRIAKAHDPSLHTAIFSTWTDNRTKLIGDGLPEAGGNKLDYAFDGFELDTEAFPHDAGRQYIKNIDAHVVAETARYIEQVGPDLSWVYIEYPDDIGHAFGDGPEQVAAVQHIDGQIGTIWNAIERRQASHEEDWLLVVTTDHGRDAETGKEHGNQTERERTIWIVTNSDRLNARFYDMPAIVDILPSIATHLGLQIPADVRDQLEGKSFID